MTLNIGIVLALACAVATQLGFLYKHRGANAAPKVDIRRPLRSVRSLFASKWFAIGMGVALGAWLLHVAALAFAPLSVVQAVLSCMCPPSRLRPSAVQCRAVVRKARQPRRCP